MTIPSYIPSDRVIQVTASYYARRIMRLYPNKTRILDVGCGFGNAADIFRSSNVSAEYSGIDIAGSREATSKVRADFPFGVFNGQSIPFGNDRFDVVYSSQVLAHCRRPDELIAEMYRVLKPGGRLIGAASHLQPFHSRSIFNITPFGFTAIAADAGFKIREIRPGADGLTLIRRSLSGNSAAYNRYFTNFSPLNRRLLRDAQSNPAGIRETNTRLLSVCGIFGFECAKPDFVIEQAGQAFHFKGEYGRTYSEAFDRGIFYEQGLLDYIAKQSIEGDYLDVGGNIGNHSLFFAGLCPSKTVHTFEPLPYIRKTLETNIKANVVGKKIKLHPFAASEKTGKDSIMFNGRKYDVNLMRLDDQLRILSGVKVIKIDAEGMEPQVLRGASAMLAKCKPRIYCEAISADDVAGLEMILGEQGYKRTGISFGPSPTHEFRHPSGA